MEENRTTDDEKNRLEELEIIVFLMLYEFRDKITNAAKLDTQDKQTIANFYDRMRYYGS